jgi:maleate cis-trans isomerase
MYGFRARIGYTSPPAATEVFPYEFYLVAPKGVSLAISTLAIVAMDKQEIDQSYEISLRAAKELARSQVDLVVLGGLPINTSRGFANVNDLIREVSADIGKPVTTSVTAQVDALRTVGARRVAVAHPFSADQDRMFAENLDNYGFEKSVIKGAGYRAVDLGVIPASVALAIGRAALAEDPNADTLWMSCPHWACAEAIDPLEKELGINVVTAHQAITWHALRRCGIDDKINGFGRLMRDF